MGGGIPVAGLKTKKGGKMFLLYDQLFDCHTELLMAGTLQLPTTKKHVEWRI
jgi:hypothetical protein